MFLAFRIGDAERRSARQLTSPNWLENLGFAAPGECYWARKPMRLERQVVAPVARLFTMTAWERLQLLVGGFGEEQAERALELLSPLIGADALPGQQVRQLPAFVGIGDSGRSDISEHVDDLLAGGFGE